MNAAATFEKLAIGGKATIIMFFLVMALINTNTSYIEKKPREFIIDSIATGVFGGLAGVFLAYTRGRGDLALNHFIFGLLLFFLYHVCREFAGYFTVFGTEEPSNKEKKQMSLLKWPLIAIITVGIGLACFYANRARVSPDYTEGIFRSLSPRTAFMLETIIFSIIVTSAEIIVTKNHGDPIVSAGLMSLAMFSFVHVLLQNGGFYEHLYGHGHPPCID
jgi:hypothetical protein